MKFCDAHWTRMTKAVEVRGMASLVATSGQDLIERMQKELSAGPSRHTFDPLMSMYWMISGRALDSLGLYLLAGDYCPICEIVKAHGIEPCMHGCTGAEVEERWIDGPADAVREHVDETPELFTLLRLN